MEALNKCIICYDSNITMVDKNSNLCMCKNCKHLFISPRPTFQEIANYYSREEKYDTWISNENARDDLWKRRLKLLKREKQDGKLLDIGTGIGQFLYHASHDFEVHGTEISESAINIAKRKYNLDIKYGEIENINFGDLKFDVITLFHVLEHVSNPLQTMSSLKNLLSKDGIVIVAVPNEGLKLRIGRIIKRLIFDKKFSSYGIPKITLDDSQGEIHLSYFTKNSMEYLLRKAGFEIIRNTLDPYYATNKGARHYLNTAQYYTGLIIKDLFNVNIYETMWIVTKIKQ